jgi:hypothetical protein
MLDWVRSRASHIARLLLLSLATAAAWEAVPHEDRGHQFAARRADIGPHAESDHELRAESSSDSEHRLHCLVCHWARAFRPLANQSTHLIPDLEAGSRVHTSTAAPAFQLLPAQRTLRSPPLSPFVA